MNSLHSMIKYLPREIVSNRTKEKKRSDEGKLTGEKEKQQKKMHDRVYIVDTYICVRHQDDTSRMSM